MTLNDFIEETSKIEQFYSTAEKTKELTTEERKIWYDELKNIDISRYRQISRQVFRKCKFMPKLADIVSINEELPYQTSKKEERRVECSKCKGLGLIFYKKRINNGKSDIEYEFVARCECQNGLKHAYDGRKISDSEHRSNYYISTANQIGL